eukprot:10969303-Alexandrium_andersonii.AAC.1
MPWPTPLPHGRMAWQAWPVGNIVSKTAQLQRAEPAGTVASKQQRQQQQPPAASVAIGNWQLAIAYSL